MFSSSQNTPILLSLLLSRMAKKVRILIIKIDFKDEIIVNDHNE